LTDYDDGCTVLLMTQGIFVEGKRPKSKKAIREAVAAGTYVQAEATSWHGDEYDGPVADMAMNSTIVFCGPNPHNDRRFYGTITRTAKGIKVT
jgi:hypothetical protein